MFHITITYLYKVSIITSIMFSLINCSMHKYFGIYIGLLSLRRPGNQEDVHELLTAILDELENDILCVTVMDS